MKKMILFVLLIVSLLSFTSCSDSFSSSLDKMHYFFDNIFYFNDVHYKLDKDGQSYYVSGTGFYHGGKVDIKSTYKGLPVTRIISLRGKVPIKKVYISKNITDVSNSIINWSDDYYKTVEWIEVSPDNATYKSIDGHLYSKDGKTLIRYAPGNKDNTFTTPKSVLQIRAHAFSNSDNLEEITFSDSISEIINYPFSDCDNLRRIYIGSGTKRVSGNAFSECDTIEVISVSARNPYYKSIDGNLYDKSLSFLIKYATGKNDSEFTIPDSVKTIGYYAFEGDRSLQYIHIPETVTTIESAAFRHCSELKSIIIPDSVKGEANQWFYGCSSLESIVLSSGITSLSDYEFSDCTSLKSVNLPSSLTVINEGMFKNCASLEEVILPENLEIIECSAFSNCTSLKRIYIPQGVSSIAPSALGSCFSLEFIEVDENNEYYKSIEANLYTKDGKVLIKYAVGKQDTSFNVPQGVEEICEGAFEGNTTLKKITIPDTVTQIGMGAFTHCTALESINIPKTVNRFGIDEMLLGCTSLKRIDFDGTMDDWHSMQYSYCGIFHVQKTNGFNIYCIDGVIEE